MKKAIVVLVAIVAVVSMASTMSVARPAYIGDVNGVCGTSYTDQDCNICHGTPNKNAYAVNHDECVICPTAPACGGSQPPAADCTDNDGDGFFLEPGCGQLYDCNDANRNIFPGAREIGCDGVDQDCSGADKTKGKGCGGRRR